LIKFLFIVFFSLFFSIMFFFVCATFDLTLTAAEDLSITKIAGLTWEQWNERLAMPLVTTLREGAHPLVFPRDLCVSTMKMESSPMSTQSEGRSPNGTPGVRASSVDPNANNSSNSGNGANLQDGFSCPDCGRMYKLKSSLRNHQKWECGKEPQFQCPYCVYRAKQKMHIGRHMERMHKEKFFKVGGDGKIIALEEALNQIVQATGCGDFNATM
jgi:hypothetical protein